MIVMSEQVGRPEKVTLVTIRNVVPFFMVNGVNAVRPLLITTSQLKVIFYSGFKSNFKDKVNVVSLFNLYCPFLVAHVVV